MRRRFKSGHRRLWFTTDNCVAQRQSNRLHPCFSNLRILSIEASVLSEVLRTFCGTQAKVAGYLE